MIKKIIILLGLPGAGKGTQGANLSKELKIPHISTGDIFRKIAETNSKEANYLREYMAAGKLVPSEMVNKVVRKFLLSEECRDGCILDGYPRNLKQAEYLLENINSDILMLFLDVKDEIVVKRILGRYNCSSCGAVYNKYFHNTKKEGVCDECGSKDFAHRTDDDEHTILSRIEEYRKETLPMVEYYKKKGKFFAVDAGATIEKVVEEVLAIVKRD